MGAGGKKVKPKAPATGRGVELWPLLARCFVLEPRACEATLREADAGLPALLEPKLCEAALREADIDKLSYDDQKRHCAKAVDMITCHVDGDLDTLSAALRCVLEQDM